MAATLREQTRGVLRSSVGRSALDLFVKRGYDKTTLDEVAATAGVSRRTLFNYFQSKEDLVLSGLAEQGDQLAERFASRPPGEDPWMPLRFAFHGLTEIHASSPDYLRVMRLLFGNDALRAGHAEKQAMWRARLAPLVAERLPRSPHLPLQADAVVATAVACLHAALAEWVRRDGRGDPLVLYDIAVDTVRGEGLGSDRGDRSPAQMPR